VVILVLFHCPATKLPEWKAYSSRNRSFKAAADRKLCAFEMGELVSVITIPVRPNGQLGSRMNRQPSHGELRHPLKQSMDDY